MILFQCIKDNWKRIYPYLQGCFFIKKFIRDQLNGGKKWRNKSCYFSVQTIITLSPDNVKVMLKLANR